MIDGGPVAQPGRAAGSSTTGLLTEWDEIKLER